MEGVFDGWGDALADGRTDIFEAADEGASSPDGGVCGVSNSSDVRAGLANPDSLLSKIP